jgi:hypothetical protein
MIKSKNNVDLQLDKTDKLQTLNRQEIDNIIAMVNSWYDHKINLA